MSWVALKDGKPGCPVIMFDGPYDYRCSLGVDDCAYHGAFEVVEREPDV